LRMAVGQQAEASCWENLPPRASKLARVPLWLVSTARADDDAGRFAWRNRIDEAHGLVKVPKGLLRRPTARALRLSIAMIAMVGFFLPFFGGNRGVIIGLVGSVIGTTVWYLMDNPYEIDNMYIALAIPAAVIFVEKLFHWNDDPPAIQNIAREA